MTSDCFVYITLPGTTAAITAGRFVLDQDRSGNALGRFVYGKRYLDNPNAVGFDPLELKLAETTYETTRLNGLFGALRDSGPDFWGRRVIEKHSGQVAMGELDYLLHSPDDRAGALGFGLNALPPAPMRAFNKTIDLTKLQTLADELIASQADGANLDVAQVQDLLLLGTSMGGARPKAVVEDEDGLWLAKFNRDDDRWNSARVEHAMLELATLCGIQAAESKLVTVAGKDVLMVKRFDREKTGEGYARTRMVSALTLLRAGDSPQERERWSYVLLAEELRRVVAQPKRDAEELFRRMVFNGLISNIDDHPRNHALIAKKRDWELSPAYDLTPSLAISLERRDLAMECGDMGRFANGKNMLTQAARFLMQDVEAQALIDTMTQTLKQQWYAVCRKCGVSETDTQTLAGAFVYEGFST